MPEFGPFDFFLGKKVPAIVLITFKVATFNLVDSAVVLIFKNSAHNDIMRSDLIRFKILYALRIGGLYCKQRLVLIVGYFHHYELKYNYVLITNLEKIF